MTYPSPNIPQIAFQPGIFTPPGVLAAIEDPDQTAGKAKVLGKWILPSGWFLDVPSLKSNG